MALLVIFKRKHKFEYFSVTRCIDWKIVDRGQENMQKRSNTCVITHIIDSLGITHIFSGILTTWAPIRCFLMTILSLFLLFSFKFHISVKPDGRKKCADARTLTIPAKIRTVAVRSASSNVHFGKEEPPSSSLTDD